MATLYELTDDYKTVQAMMEEGDESFRDTLESIETAIEDKLNNIGKVLKNLEGEVAAYKTEEKRLADKRKVIENNIKNLKKYAEEAMITVGERNVKTPLFTFRIQKNAPSVHVLDEKLIPKNYYVPVDPRLDKKSIMEMLKNNESIPGVELKQTESIRIQ